ncbi:methyltransferase [Paractinoplanes toevensis]|uniref:Methyltransferase n=1 Tax=Paractinoplanes toevensis TaxID=571911 RepID=A0A919W1L0_9ACTN|nr:methyltransferase [Actinoplanes toevensis]GIM92597.1 methyltransferase [Actinoplanes toevensis]
MTHPIPDDLHAQHLILLACSNRLSQIVEALVELDVATLLADGPLPIATLAEKTATHELSLYRLLRCAAAVGIFAEGPQQVFALTPLAEGLVATNPQGVLTLAQYNRSELTNAPYRHFMHSIRTGEAAFPRAFGMPFLEYLHTHPEVDAGYDRFMSHWSRQFAEEELREWGFDRFSSIADLGGGDGYFLSQVLARFPQMRGHLIELPWIAEKAQTLLTAEGFADRVTVQHADLLEQAPPAGFDVYFLKAVLHDLNDEDARTVLGNVRAAIGDSGARLQVVDSVLDPGNGWDHGKFLDLDMLVLHGGRERTLDDWNTLFSDTGFRLVSTPIYHWTLLECEAI